VQSVLGLEGKRILVLGAGQGMGEASARLLASLGCELALVDLEQERAERMAGEILAGGGRALPIVADVTDDEALVAAIARAGRDLGPLDGLVSIVGMAGFAPLVEMSMEMWDADHRRNLRYFFLAAREVARSLLERQAPGSLVGVASIDGMRSAPRHAAYGAAKAGLMNLIRSMAAEWSAHGIRANAIAPGVIATPRYPSAAGFMGERLQSLPMARLGRVEEIAKVAAFFLSDLSSYVTGQTLAVDGGYEAVGIFTTPAPPA
jgi:NAD(P)-dependent dehydrogenase (short-subunit alcohol dehydrogenase family)